MNDLDRPERPYDCYALLREAERALVEIRARLKPCPWCGKVPRATTRLGPSGKNMQQYVPMLVLNCSPPHTCRIIVSDYDFELLVTWWNTRKGEQPAAMPLGTRRTGRRG